MTPKKRLSVTVENEFVEAGQMAVEEGAAANLSAWVNDALRLKATRDRGLRALDAYIHEYEAEHGEITEDEIFEAERRAAARALVVRGSPDRQQASGNISDGID